MKKVTVAAAALALTASAAAIPTKAHAFAWWLLPVINGAVDMGTTAMDNGDDDTGGCHTVRERGRDGRWHRVESCE
jgi:hypothetical protein